MKPKLFTIENRRNFDFQAYTLSAIIEYMKEKGLTEIKVSSLKAMHKSSFFYCKKEDEIYEHDRNIACCGKECSNYIPRNGKGGCCKYRAYCLEKNKSYTLNIDGKLKEIQI